MAVGVGRLHPFLSVLPGQSRQPHDVPIVGNLEEYGPLGDASGAAEMVWSAVALKWYRMDVLRQRHDQRKGFEHQIGKRIWHLHPIGDRIFRTIRTTWPPNIEIPVLDENPHHCGVTRLSGVIEEGFQDYGPGHLRFPLSKATVLLPSSRAVQNCLEKRHQGQAGRAALRSSSLISVNICWSWLERSSI